MRFASQRCCALQACSRSGALAAVIRARGARPPRGGAFLPTTRAGTGAGRMSTMAAHAAWCWEASARAAERVAPPDEAGAPPQAATPVLAAPAAAARAALEALPPAARRWADACGAKWGGKSGELLLVPGPEVRAPPFGPGG